MHMSCKSRHRTGDQATYGSRHIAGPKVGRHAIVVGAEGYGGERKSVFACTYPYRLSDGRRTNVAIEAWLARKNGA